MNEVQRTAARHNNITDQTDPRLPDSSVIDLGRWIFVAGAIVAALGFMVLAGWHAHAASLIQLHPTLVPMQYNTATAFLLSGGMLMAHARDLRRVELALGATVATIGILTLVEYIAGVDLGIDQLLMKHYITVQTSHPGRMAPNTAVCFSLAGIAIVLSAGLLGQFAARINRTFGSLVLGLGVAALLGYFLELETAYGWGRLTRMAVHTALGFVVLGLGLLACAWRVEQHLQGKILRWLPIPTAVVVLAITFALWQALHPERGIVAIESAHNYVLFFGIALAATLGMTLQKVASESAARYQLEAEIAERVKAEAALHQYERIVSSTADMLAMVDRRCVYLVANRAYAQAFGKTPEEMIGQTPALLFGDEVFNTVIRPRVERCLAGEEVCYREWFEFPRGARKYLEVLYSPYRGKDDEIGAFVVSTRDITAQKQVEEERRRYEHIVSSTTDMLALFDRRYVYLAANEAYLQAFGKTSEEVIGQTPALLYGDEVFNAVIRPLAERCLAGEDVHHQRWMEFQGSGRKYLDILYSPYRGTDDEILGFIVTARDITESEKLQTQLRQAQKIESVSQLAAGLGHGFNNMLGVILGNAELALEGVDPSQPIHADLTEIHKAAGRAADLTRQLLAFASIQTIAPSVLDLNETVDGMIEMLRRLIGENIELSWQPLSGIWPVKMDPSQISQVLSNLCINTRDAIEDVGHVSIETRNTSFDAAYCVSHLGFSIGEYVLLSVSDDGCGMDQETLARIYEPFFTTKELGQGTGLGLAMVYGIVQQNGGFINVRSKIGQGTAFEIYLPRQVATVSRLQEMDPAQPTIDGDATILLVEDEPAILKLTMKMLERLGYKVLAAATPGEALHLAEAHAGEIDLLLTDVMMPEMNGRDLAEKLSSAVPQLKQLFMSGYTADVIADKGVLNEDLSFIQKPFSQQALAAKVQSVLTSE